MILSWDSLKHRLETKLPAILNNEDLATLDFQKISHIHPPKSEPCFRKVNIPLAKLGTLFHACIKFLHHT